MIESINIWGDKYTVGEIEDVVSGLQAEVKALKEELIKAYADLTKSEEDHMEACYDRDEFHSMLLEANEEIKRLKGSGFNDMLPWIQADQS